MGSGLGLAICTFWHGIVLEMVLRAGAMVSSTIAFITAAIALGTSDSDILNGNAPPDDLSRGIIGSSAAVVAIAVISVALGGLFFLIRFLNADTINDRIQMFLTSSIVVGGLLAAGHFACGVAAAYYADDDALALAASIFGGDFARVKDSLAVAAAFCFISLPFYVLLAIWNILFLVMKWSKEGGQDN